MAADLTCRELVELVTDYFEGALDARDRAAFAAHIAGCDGCTAYLEQLEATIRVTGTLTPEDLPQAAETALLQAFRHWRGAS